MYITQIKEKFGSLRFYMSHEDDYITGATTMIEYLSNSVCEICGSYGSSKQIGGWVQTLCEPDTVKAIQEHEARLRESIEDETVYPR